MKKILLIICLMLCCGCTDYVEINDLAIVSGMIIDYVDNKYEVTTELIINDENTNIKTYKTVAPSLEKCLDELSKVSNKKIFLSHLKVLLLTDNIIENDIDFYNYFLRNSKLKMNFYVYSISNDDKDKIFTKSKESVSLYIEKMMEFNSDVFSSSTPLLFIDLVYKKLENNLNEVYPRLSIKDNNDNQILYLDNLLFYNKEKIFLSELDSINYNILTNNIKETTFDFKCESNSFSLNLKDIKTKYKFENNSFIFNIDIISSINNNECDYKLDINKMANKLNELSSNQLKDKLLNTINISKENNYDFIGIGNYIYKHNKKYYKKWNKDLNDINVIININNSINSGGEKR